MKIVDCDDVELEFMFIGQKRYKITHTGQATGLLLNGEKILTTVHAMHPSKRRAIFVIARGGFLPHVLMMNHGNELVDDERWTEELLQVFGCADPWPTDEEFSRWLYQQAGSLEAAVVPIKNHGPE